MRWAALLFVLLSPACNARSIVLYLANIASESSNAELMQSLSALNTVFLSMPNQQYPVVVAYDQEDTPALTPELQSVLSASVNTTIHFAPVRRFKHIPWPFSMYTSLYKEDNPYYAPLGYRWMCRFWAHTVFSQPFMQNVTSYLRLDTDTFLVEMPINPFTILQDENLAYLAPVMYKETLANTHGLWETFLRFARDEQIHSWGLAPLSRQGGDSFSENDIREMPLRAAINVLYQRGYNLDYYYNNWEVSRVDAWTSPAYQRLAKHIAVSGGIVIWRWGDAPIRTLSLYLLREIVPSRQYRGFRVYHKAYHATAGTESSSVLA
jgi:hypothetical protein